MNKAISVVLAGVLMLVPFMTAKQAIAETNYVVIDPTDFSYQITCDAPDVYMTLLSQGAIARVEKGAFNSTKYFATDDGKSGSNFYSIVFEPVTNSIFVNEETSGWIWKYDISANSWDSVKLTNGTDRTHSFQQLLANDGAVWSALGVDEAGGFAGIAKIDPVDLSFELMGIGGAIAPSALHVDFSNSNAMWMADRGTHEIYKFDLTTEEVVQEFSIPTGPGGSNVHSLASDATWLYIPLGYTGTPEDDVVDYSLILKVRKANVVEQITIDTLAVNLGEGTFAVHLDRDADGTRLLRWSDNSGHIGYIDLATNAKFWENSGALVNNIYFGCEPTSESKEWYWAAHGSAAIGQQTEDAKTFKIVETSKVKQTTNTAIRKDVQVTITASYGCTTEGKVTGIGKTMKGAIKIDGVEQTATKVTFKQVSDTAFTWSATQSWGKVNGKSTFGTTFDCRNDKASQLSTLTNTMTLVKSGITYTQLAWSDNGSIAFN